MLSLSFYLERNNWRQQKNQWLSDLFFSCLLVAVNDFREKKYSDTFPFAGRRIFHFYFFFMTMNAGMALWKWSIVIVLLNGICVCLSNYKEQIWWMLMKTSWKISKMNVWKWWWFYDCSYRQKMRLVRKINQIRAIHLHGFFFIS